ncbi:MAG: radical SAM family heme chaperone HemW [Bacillota bacterium]|nr:radical SAM family heme chaperone HemW [Bacillota bacterium]
MSETGCCTTMPDWISLPVTAAYIHIPFCVRKCTYCDFVSYACADRARQQAYIDALIHEITSVADYYRTYRPELIRPLRTLFLGGGTPTVLAATQTVRILEHIRHTFGFEPDCECTIEANPGTVTRKSLDSYRSAGINRLSLGLQAIQPHLLRILGRIHSADDLRTSVAAARAAGFTNINVDVLVGLPEQTLDDVRQTVATICSLPLQHISFYSLILEEGTPLAAVHESHALALPSDEYEREQYHLVRRMLAAHGFRQYEISNSARPGYECRHNRVYWDALPYYGFGLAAHSYVAGVRSGNTADLDEYISAFDSPLAGKISPLRQKNTENAERDNWQDARPVAIVTEIIDRDEAMREMMLLGLRLTDGVQNSAFQERFGCSLFSVFTEEIRLLSQRGLVIVSNDRIRLSDSGLDLANQAFQLFIK